MSKRVPISALKTIMAYCESTQCRRCPFGDEGNDGYIGCSLMDTAPCDWMLSIAEAQAIKEDGK